MWSQSEVLWVSFEIFGVTGAVGTAILTALGYCGVLILGIVIGFALCTCIYKVNIKKDLIEQQKVKIENNYHLHLHGEMPYKKRIDNS